MVFLVHSHQSVRFDRLQHLGEQVGAKLEESLFPGSNEDSLPRLMFHTVQDDASRLVDRDRVEPAPDASSSERQSEGPGLVDLEYPSGILHDSGNLLDSGILLDTPGAAGDGKQDRDDEPPLHPST